MSDGTTRTVLITGASGNIGAKVVAALERRKDLGLKLLDLQPDAAGRVVAADLRRPNAQWERLCEGVDTIVHLAANPDVHAPWPALAADNVETTLNVFQAAVAGGVKRVIYASSLQVLLGYEALPHITADLPPNPLNFYGVSKSVGERIAESFARRYGVSTICLRFGMVRRGANPPPAGHPSLATQRRWLSNADLCQAVALAIDAGPIDFAAVNVTSSIVGSPWSLAEAERTLGYVPGDHFVPVGPALRQRVRTRALEAKGRLVRLLGSVRKLDDQGQ